MSITKEKKDEIIQNYATGQNDTGSVEVQCAILTSRINVLTAHLNANKKDFSSKRGMLVLVGRRRRLLAYLKKHHLDRYVNLIQRLGLRK
jgi:small subunit ribosomal protein S15